MCMNMKLSVVLVALLAGCSSGDAEPVISEESAKNAVDSVDTTPNRKEKEVATRFDQIEAEYAVAVKKIETATLDSSFDLGTIEELQSRTNELLNEASTDELKEEFSLRMDRLQATAKQATGALTQINQLDTMGQGLFEALLAGKDFSALAAVNDQLDAFPEEIGAVFAQRRTLIRGALQTAASIQAQLTEAIALSDADLASAVNRNTVGESGFRWKSLAVAATEYAARTAAASEQNRRSLLAAQLELRANNEVATKVRPLFISAQEDLTQFSEDLSYGSHVILFPTKSLKLAAMIADGAGGGDNESPEDAGRQLLESTLSGAELSSEPDCLVDLTSLSDVLIRTMQTAKKKDRQNASDQRTLLPLLAYAGIQHIGSQLVRSANLPARQSSKVSRDKGSSDLVSQRIEDSYAFVGILDRPVDPVLFVTDSSESGESDRDVEAPTNPDRLTLRVSAVIRFAGRAPGKSVVSGKPVSPDGTTPAPWRKVQIYTEKGARTDAVLAITNSHGTAEFLKSWPAETASPLVLPSATYQQRISETPYLHYVLNNEPQRRDTESAYKDDFAPHHVYSDTALDRAIQRFLKSAGPLDPDATPTQQRRLVRVFESGRQRDLHVFVGNIINAEGERLTELTKCLSILNSLDRSPSPVRDSFSKMLQTSSMWYAIPSSEGIHMVHVQNIRHFVTKIIDGLNMNASRKSDHQALKSVREMIVSHEPAAYRPPNPPEPQPPRERKPSISVVTRFDEKRLNDVTNAAKATASVDTALQLMAAQGAMAAAKTGNTSLLGNFGSDAKALAGRFTREDVVIDKGYKPSRGEIAAWRARHAEWQRRVAAIERQWQEDQQSVGELWPVRRARLETLVNAVEENRINIRREIVKETRRMDIHYKSGKSLDEFDFDLKKDQYLSDPYETFPIIFIHEATPDVESEK
jgi:hypothetical protein